MASGRWLRFLRWGQLPAFHGPVVKFVWRWFVKVNYCSLSSRSATFILIGTWPRMPPKPIKRESNKLIKLNKRRGGETSTYLPTYLTLSYVNQFTWLRSVPFLSFPFQSTASNPFNIGMRLCSSMSPTHKKKRKKKWKEGGEKPVVGLVPSNPAAPTKSFQHELRS